jgi:hypothetical protein
MARLETSSTFPVVRKVGFHNITEPTNWRKFFCRSRRHPGPGPRCPNSSAWPEPTFGENDEQEARDGRELDARLLGHDLLRVSAILIGQRGLLTVFDFEQPPQAA